MKVYEALAELFHSENTTHCFALLGDANMNWAAALDSRGVEFIYVRDEHNAVAAAMSWARTTQGVGVASVTCGPGLTQILTALPAAVRANIPLVVFVGEAPLRKPWYNQGIEHRAFVEACGAQYVSVAESDNADESNWVQRVRGAFDTARTQNCPVVIGFPLDLQEDLWNDPALLSHTHTVFKTEADIAHELTPAESQIAAALKLIASAKRIVVLAGLGAVRSDAAAEALELADVVDGLLATTLPARGLFWQDPFYLGVAGGFSSDTARKYLQQADLVIAIGTSLASHTSDGGKLWPAERVLHIDKEPRTENQGLTVAHHHICADAAVGLRQLLRALKSHQQFQSANSKGWRSEAIANEIATAPADNKSYTVEPGLLDPRELVTVLEKSIPTDWHTVNSSGHCAWFTAQMHKRPANRFFTLREFGAIGNGVAFALGVAVADDQRPVVLFDGDGSFLMHLQELETIARHGHKILVCVINDGAYGSEIHKLRAHGLADTGGMFGRPDFAAIAEGFGLQGRTIRDLNEIPQQLMEFEKSSVAAVWDFHVCDQVVSPLIRRSHGIN